MMKDKKDDEYSTMDYDSVVFMQARLDSSRLPKKALLPLGGGTSLEMAMQNLYGCADGHYLLSPCDSKVFFNPLTTKWGYSFIEGSKNDVLERFAHATEMIKPKWIIRATADNSLIGKELAVSLLRHCKESDCDYGCYLQTPHGGGVEVIRAEALLRAHEKATSSFDREHVCPYIYSHKNEFKTLLITAPIKWHAPKLRATLDNLEDYLYLQKVYKALYTGRAITLEEFIIWATSNSQNQSAIQNKVLKFYL